MLNIVGHYLGPGFTLIQHSLRRKVGIRCLNSASLLYVSTPGGRNDALKNQLRSIKMLGKDPAYMHNVAKKI